MNTNDMKAEMAALKAENEMIQAELEMEAAMADAFARGVLLADPNFDWRDLEVQ
jgi:hypothetical protein